MPQGQVIWDDQRIVWDEAPREMAQRPATPPLSTVAKIPEPAQLPLTRLSNRILQSGPVGAALEAVQKGVLEPIDRFVEARVNQAIRIAEKSYVPRPRLKGESEEDYVYRETFHKGATIDTVKIGAGLLADPRNWPFLASGVGALKAAVRPALKAAIDVGFTAMMETGAIQELQAGNYQSAAVSQAFALLGMANAPKNIKAALAKRVAAKAKTEAIPKPEAKPAEAVAVQPLPARPAVPVVERPITPTQEPVAQPKPIVAQEQIVPAAPKIVPRGTLGPPARPAIPAPEGTVLPIGIPGTPPFRTTPVKPLSPLRKFVNPEIEERFQAAKVSPQETWWDRAKQSLETFQKRATRTYEHLERGEKYGPLIFNLKQNEVAGSIAIDRTLRDLTGITKGMDRNQLDLFSKRVVLDDLAENYARLTAKGEQWDELAFGITPKELNAEAARFHGLSEADPTVAEALKKRRGMADSVKTEYIAAMDKVGVDLGDRLAREDYFRHRVLEHLADRVNVGEGKQLRTPIGRGFLKGRTINPLDYSTNYLESEFEVIAQMRADTAKAKTLAWIADEKNGLNIKSRVQAEAKRINQEMKAAGDESSPVIWEDLVPEGYGLWQPREGNVFYLAKSIPESIANKLIEGGMKEIGLTAKDVRKVLAMGGKRNQLVLPDEVIATLDNLGRKETDPYLQASAKLLNYWKQWQLISPGRVVKYNLRNVSGDLDAVIAGNPSALRQMRQTIDDLGNFYVKGEISADLKGYLERGGIQTLLQAQEMGNVTALADLRKFAATEKSMAAKVAGAPVEAIKGIAQKLRSATDFREAILRYATYLDYLRQMRVGSGKPKNYGASIPEEVRALADPKDRAFKLQNDLIGAYNEISVLGQHVRRHWYPFWSFPEINIRRYTQLFKNASREGKLPEQVGRSLLGKIPATAYTAYQVGKFAMKASALWAIVTAQNMLFFPEEEEELPDDVKGRLHIVLGRTKDGQVRYFSRLGAVGDLLEWVGLDAPQQLVQDYLNGRKTVKEIGSEMALSPVNKVVSGLSPFPKMPIELLTGRSLFPDVSRPRTIRDRGLYAAQQFAVDGIYRELTGLPARPYLSSLGRTVVYYSDPGEAAYYGILDLKASYLRKINKGGEGTFTSPRTEAIRNVKLAIRYNDKEAVEKYVAEYVALGGKRSGIVESIERMEPLYGLNRRQQRDFRGKLSVADNEKLEKATRFWKDVLKKGKVEIRSALAKPPAGKSLVTPWSPESKVIWDEPNP